MTSISERQRARVYTYKKKKNCETFLYKKSPRVYKNQDNFRYIDVFYIQKPDTPKKGRQFASHFYAQKSGYFALRNFH